jgi:hypothetical protein
VKQFKAKKVSIMASTNVHPFGKAECIVEFSKNHEFIINHDPLKKLLNHEKVKNRKVVAFSIVGAFRKGKSYFLGYCLRYLYENVSLISLTF